MLRLGLIILVSLSCVNESSLRPNFFKFNYQILASKGQIIQAQVKGARFQQAPRVGWTVSYEFRLQPNGEVFTGFIMGPKNYYSSFSVGDKIAVVYLPEDPRMNLDIYYLLNAPAYSHTRSIAFSNKNLTEAIKKVPIKDYTSHEWGLRMIENE